MWDDDWRSDEEEIDIEDDGNDSSEEDDMDDSREEDSDEEETSDEDEDMVDGAIVEQFICTFHNCSYDVKFDDALCLDRSSPLPVRSIARPTQASYNKPDNWRERNRIGLDKIKGQLQNKIHSVSHDQCVGLMLTHNIYEEQLMDNEEIIVWHEPILDRYWDVLEAEIDRMRRLDGVVDIKDIQITNVEMKKERLAALLAIFCNGGAKNLSAYLDFNNANLCGEGIVSLSKLIGVSSKLQEFCLRHNRIDNKESARCLSRSLKLHSSINKLDLTHCDLGSNPEILLVILQSDVKWINLDNNNIDSLGAVKIAEYLEGNPPIWRIDLDHNHLSDDDAILISRALKRNTSLKTIYLQGNNFTSIGVKALLTCVFDSSSLNAISESNHSLNQLILFTRRSNILLLGCINRMLDLDMMQKIFLALQDKDSLLQYLKNVPVELFPEVLEFILWVDDQPQRTI
jgi:hypothetical protein